MTRAAWLEARKQGIGASESAAIIGRHPWLSAWTLWARKTGQLAEAEETERMRWGTVLEGPILEEWARRQDAIVERHPQDEIIEHPDYPDVPMICTPDAWLVDPRDPPPEERGGVIIEVKTASAYSASEWRDGAPIHYLIQVQHQMACTWAVAAYIVVLIGGQELRTVEAERDERFIRGLERRCSEWWQRHIIDGEEPEMDGHTSTVDAISRLHPEDTGEEIDLPDEAAAWDVQLARLGQVIAANELEKAGLENKLRRAIGNATYGVLPHGGRWSWKRRVDGTRVLRRVR